jgi:hypothetical protein
MFLIVYLDLNRLKSLVLIHVFIDDLDLNKLKESRVKNMFLIDYLDLNRLKSLVSKQVSY